jgi:hypothetical protein
MNKTPRFNVNEIVEDLVWTHVYCRKHPDFMGLAFGLVNLGIPAKQRDRILDEAAAAVL